MRGDISENIISSEIWVGMACLSGNSVAAKLAH